MRERLVSVGLAIFLSGDNFRQMILDESSLVRLVQNPDLDLSPLAPALGTTAPKLDGTRIHWSGGSLGGIVGSMTASVEPEIRAAAQAGARPGSFGSS